MYIPFCTGTHIGIHIDHCSHWSICIFELHSPLSFAVVLSIQARAPYPGERVVCAVHGADLIFRIGSVLGACATDVCLSWCVLVAFCIILFSFVCAWPSNARTAWGVPRLHGHALLHRHRQRQRLAAAHRPVCTQMKTRLIQTVQICSLGVSRPASPTYLVLSTVGVQRPGSARKG